ncbi:copper resistance protein CopC [Streptomyces sp. NPDC007264]|uniref:copper resistance CopC/CopD family protein n=1 Tax=Streptomyces sp. NPDC007264 TaxID=3364777 RepID=UPI0036D91A4A
MTNSRRPGGPFPLSALVRALAATAAGVVLLLATAAPASAHAEPVATVPAAGAVLDRAPRTVSMRFSEPVEATADGLRVLGPDGSRADTGHTAPLPDRPDALAVTLGSGLPDGAYTVSWRAVSADSHPVHGAFTFTVGTSTAGPMDGAGRAPDLPADADRGSDPLLAAAVAAARGVGYAGLALLTGAIGMMLLAPDGTGRGLLRRLALSGGLIVIASACAGLVAQGPYAAGAGPGSLLDPALLRPALTGRPGLTTGARVLLTGLLLVPVARDLPRPAASWRAVPRRVLPVMAALAAVAATYSAAGHAATGRWVPLALTVDVLHLLAMGWWLGGLVALGVLYAQREPPEPPTVATRRFSTAAGWCVAVLVVTGVVQARRQLGGPERLLSSDYGRLLVVKVLAVMLLLVPARLARRWTRTHARGPMGAVPQPTDGRAPRAARPGFPAGEDARPAQRVLRSMRRTLAVETVLGAVVVALSTLLSGSAPPHGAGVPATAASSVSPPVRTAAGYDTGSPGGRGTVSARVARQAGGGIELELRLADPTGSPVQAEEIRAAWSLPALRLGPLPTELAATGPGRWSGTVRLSPPGAWRLAVTVRTSDTDAATVVFDDITTGTAPSAAGAAGGSSAVPGS